MAYDSAKDTREHIETVRYFLSKMMARLLERSEDHDESKLQEPEKSVFDEFTPKLEESTYGSDEYMGFLKDMDVALKHHYANNSHHPEHFKMWECPICDSIFREEDAPIDVRFMGDVRLCPVCCKHGTIMECQLEPASGIYGMSLLDVMEMLADWKAAGMRHADGDIRKSLEINRGRFKISDQLFRILENTVKELEL